MKTLQQQRVLETIYNVRILKVLNEKNIEEEIYRVWVISSKFLEHGSVMIYSDL